MAILMTFYGKIGITYKKRTKKCIYFGRIFFGGVPHEKIISSFVCNGFGTFGLRWHPAG
jgi:hypothetical protein